MDFSYIVKILFISINTVLTFATFYESVSVAQPKCDGIKQKSGLSKIECILVCQRKKKVGALKGGHCICFETSCTSSEETDRDRVNPQMTTVFRKMVRRSLGRLGFIRTNSFIGNKISLRHRYFNKMN